MANTEEKGWVKGAKSLGPPWMHQTVVMACWWMAREIELTAALASHVTIVSDGEGCGMCSWLMPVSKQDHLALGKKRTLRSACPSVLCSVKAAKSLKHIGTTMAKQLQVEELHAK